MSAAKTILILGGGVGGLVAANRLRKDLPAQHRVILVEREASHVFAPSLLWVMVGARRLPQITRGFDGLARKGIEVVRGEVESLNPERKEAVVAGRVLKGDYVIVALGAEFCPEAVPGLAEGGHTFCTPAGAEALRAALAEFPGGRLLILTAAPAYKCPAAPYEAAMLIEADLRKRGLRDRTQIDLFAAEPGPMGVAGQAAAQGRGLRTRASRGGRPRHRAGGDRQRAVRGVRWPRRVLRRDGRRQGGLRIGGLLRRARAARHPAGARPRLARGQGALREALALAVVLMRRTLRWRAAEGEDRRA